MFCNDAPKSKIFLGKVATLGGVFVMTGFRPTSVQAQSLERVVESRAGIVVAIDGNQIFLNSSSGALTLKLNSSVRIWKGEDGVAMNTIHPGDDLALRGIMDADGTFVPSEIWVNITSLDGVIKKVDGPTVDIDVIRNDGLPQAKRIKVTDKTFSLQNVPLKREHLKVGRQVHVIGLALADGSIQATRLTVYVNGKPIDTEGFKLIDPVTGRRIERK